MNCPPFVCVGVKNFRLSVFVKLEAGQQSRAKQDNAENGYRQERRGGKFVAHGAPLPCRQELAARGLGVTKQYEGAVSESLPQNRKMVSSEPASVSWPLNVKHLHKLGTVTSAAPGFRCSPNIRHSARASG